MPQRTASAAMASPCRALGADEQHPAAVGHDALDEGRGRHEQGLRPARD